MGDTPAKRPADWTPQAVGVGVLSFLVGFATTAVTTAFHANSVTSGVGGFLDYYTAAGGWRVVVGLFLRAHGVPGSGELATGSDPLALSAGSGAGVLVLLPPLLLVLAGAGLATRWGAESARHGAVVGAGCALGYAAAGGLGALVAVMTAGDGVSAVTYVPVVVVVVGAFAVLFGAAGGAVAAVETVDGPR